MTYEKPEVVAQNAATGSYAAGCPTKNTGGDLFCKNCERTKQCVLRLLVQVCTLMFAAEQYKGAALYSPFIRRIMRSHQGGCALRCSQADSVRIFLVLFLWRKR